MKGKNWLILNLALVLLLLCVVAFSVVRVDPYLHYHAPRTDEYFYKLDLQRYLNNGITKNMEYEAIITGTSMIENFKTTEFEEIFGLSAVKLPYMGASYHEINENLKIAAAKNPELKMVLRCLDYFKLFEPADLLRDDLGSYPDYLYDDSIFNDYEYVFNKTVLFSRVYKMASEDREPGMTSFDDYSSWIGRYGLAQLYPEAPESFSPGEPVSITEAERAEVLKSIRENICAIAEEYPDIEFVCFFSPYSAAWWQEQWTQGTLHKHIEAERIAIEEMLRHENIKVFSFNMLTDFTTDLNNYKDTTHYGPWLNSQMLRWISAGEYRLTEENYRDYLEAELDFYTRFDYNSLLLQEDYEDDMLAEKAFRAAYCD